MVSPWASGLATVAACYSLFDLIAFFIWFDVIGPLDAQIQFPDRVVLQATFSSTEGVKDLVRLVRESFAESHRERKVRIGEHNFCRRA